MLMLMFFNGSDILAIRSMFKLKQKQFGAVLGVTEATVSRWEADLRRPRYDVMEKLNDLAEQVGYLKPELSGQPRKRARPERAAVTRQFAALRPMRTRVQKSCESITGD